MKANVRGHVNSIMVEININLMPKNIGFLREEEKVFSFFGAVLFLLSVDVYRDSILVLASFAAKII